MGPKIAVMHHPDSLFPFDLVREIGGEAELLWVVDEAFDSDALTSSLLRRLGTVVDIGGLDLDEAARLLSTYQPDGVVSYVDDHLLRAAALASRLGFRYHTTEVAETLVDKRLQRAALVRSGIPGPRFWPIPTFATAAEIQSIASEVRYPAVLKPARGSGSRGIGLVRDVAELVAAIDAGTEDTAYLVEEYLPDEPDHDEWFASYVSVESVVSFGRVSHAAITGRFPLAEPFRETGNFVPAMPRRDLYRPVMEMVSEAIAALGISDAVIHTEIKFTPDGPKLIEVNGRLGGRPPFVLRDVSNLNLFQTTCRVAAGVPVALDGLAECNAVGYWLMLQPPYSARRILSIDGIDEVAELAGVESVRLRREAGDAVDWREGTASHVVTVRGRAIDHETLSTTIGIIENRVRIDYGR